MKRELPKHVYQKPGGVYFQRRGWPTVRMESKPGTPEFHLEYAKIMQGSRPAAPVTKRTFNALVKSYIESPKYRRLSARSRDDYDKVLVWVRDKIGPLPVEKMSRKNVIAAQHANQERIRFANYIVQVLRILFEHSIDLGWRTDNPAKGVSLLKSEGEGRKPWPKEKIEAYRATATGPALLIFELCLGTGQRIGDVLKMRWSDIRDGGIYVTQGKTKASLWIPLTPTLRQTLEDTPRTGMTILAWGPAGKPYTYRGAADLVMAVRRKIDAMAFDIHGLRYAAAAELASAGATDEEIMAITGHKTSAMVARYAGDARQRARASSAQKRRE